MPAIHRTACRQPRAGHAASILGNTWFIVGGGNNTSGCADMYALELSALGTDAPLEVRARARGRRGGLGGCSC